LPKNWIAIGNRVVERISSCAPFEDFLRRHVRAEITLAKNLKKYLFNIFFAIEKIVQMT